MAYRVTVPISNDYAEEQGREKLAEELQKLDAHRVLLVINTYEVEPEKEREALDRLRENCRFFHGKGFEVGAWLWAFTMPDRHPYSFMVNFEGQPLYNGGMPVPQVCPTDEKFLEFSESYIEKLVGCGIDLVLFDDDLRYGDLGSETPGCLCANHVCAINRALGTAFTREEIAERIRTGGRNEVRTAYLNENGNAFRRFAGAMRAAANRVNPQVRIGYCCCMSAWDIDGTDPRELAYLFAGETRPFVRLSGAPYWGPDITNAVEYSRMESAWTRDGNIEILGEGDSFPRPRTRCPASYIEAFDTALRASGATDGILKYAIDYFSLADYETGYREFHERNRSLYVKISRHFDGKRAVGIRVFESMKKYADMEYSEPPRHAERTDSLPRSAAGSALSYCSVPTVYETEAEGVCAIALGENTRRITEEDMKYGLITDAAGAKILTKRGFDVGVIDFSEKVYEPVTEVFSSDGNRIYAEGVPVYGVRLSPDVEILSFCETEDGRIPMSYRYENADGIKVLVWNFRCRHEKTNILRHYARSRQIADTVRWFGRALPVYAYGNPGFYLQAKADGNAMTVGAWNCSVDPALHPVIELDRPRHEITFFAGSGRLDGDQVYLDEVAAYGFAGFEVR